MKIAKNWSDLAGLENENYYLDINIDFGCGWIRSKETDESVAYLTTHTFYKSKYRFCTAQLQHYGFEVELVGY